MGVRVFRSHRLWLSNPHGMKVGFGLAMTGVLFAFFFYFMQNQFSPEELTLYYYILAGISLLGVIMMIRCAMNDRNEIHSFLLTDEGEMYHIAVAIPEHVIPLTTFFDPFGTRDRSYRRTTFSDAVRLTCAGNFESKAREALINRKEAGHLGWMQSNNPYSAAADMNKMEDAVIEKITITGATIRYKMEGRDIFLRAKLFRHNSGYKVILDRLRGNKR